MKKITIAALLLTLQSVFAAEHINILIYHHVSENTPASTSVSPAQFREHLQFFKDHNYTVLSLPDALNAINQGDPLPTNAIAITFDDGYRNIYDNALPLLNEFDYPFTVFVATDPIDQNFGDMLNWDQLREMKQSGVTIANHSTDHSYMVRYQVRDERWQTEIKQNIEQAQKRLIDELGGDIPKWFAYPYGEFNAELQSLLLELGYTGFAQHSGGVWKGSNNQALPRFAAAGIYANTNTLKTKIESHPMPVDESTLSDMLTEDARPALTVSLTDITDLNKTLNCFINGHNEDASWSAPNVFHLQSQEPLSEGRHRYNCTSRSKTENFYYWFSKPWLVYQTKKK